MNAEATIIRDRGATDEARWDALMAEGDPPRGISLAHHILDRAQLAALPSPEPLIEHTLDLGTVTVLAGYWGTLKSFIALDWAASIATGRPWMGRPTAQRKTLYVAAEGAYGLDDRLTAWETGWRRTIDPTTFHVLPVPAHLGSLNAVAELCGIIQRDAYGFVVIDTLAKSITGMDENSAQDMGRAVSALYDLQRATNGGAVLAVHHTGKDKTTIRGSSALEAGVDCVYTTEGDAHNLKLSRTKRKDGPREDVHTLKFSEVKHTRSGVVESHSGVRQSPSTEALLSHFRSLFSETGASGSQIKESTEMPRGTMYRALNALVKAGDIVKTGTDTRPFYRLADR